MSKRQKAKKRKNPPAAVPPRGKFPFMVPVALAVAALGVLCLWRMTSRPAATPSIVAAKVEAPVSKAPGSEAPARPEFQKLKGRWLRPDGGYIIEVKNVEDTGLLDVAYFNPRPIHVSKAVALQDAGVTKVFIELRDANYPGSTYTLVYDPTNDQLTGIYFQALERHSFEVFFERVK
jgi:hypothetical protein